MTATTTTEYGLRFDHKLHDVIDVWPDEDGDIDVRGTAEWAQADPDNLRVVVRHFNATAPHGDGYTRARLIARTHSTTETELVSDPFPTTPGSVVRATVEGTRGTFVLDGWNNNPYWSRVSPAPAARTVMATTRDMVDVVVLFDAADGAAL